MSTDRGIAATTRRRSPGRIELAVIAEAWRALGDAIATAGDIDVAMRLGAGHRVGPSSGQTSWAAGERCEARLDARQAGARLRDSGDGFARPAERETAPIR